VVGKLGNELVLDFRESLAMSAEFGRLSLFGSASLIISYPLITAGLIPSSLLRRTNFLSEDRHFRML
jgi:hypothetical protein